VAFVFPLARKKSVVVALAAAFIGLAGPIAYSVDTLASAHSGAIPSAGPSSGGMHGMGGPGMRPGGDGGGPGADGPATTGARNGAPSTGGTPPDGARTGTPSDGAATGAQAGIPSDGGAPGQDGAAATGGSAQGANGGEQRMGGTGGLLGGSRPSDRIVTLLESNGTDYTWVAAAVGSNNAAGYQLATELPVMPIGGFNGSDPSPTLEQFQQYVAGGEIHYFVAGGRGGPGGNSESTSSAITAWVTANYPSTTVDSVTLYDLTQPKS
jgi:hypothetical protein